MASNVSNPLVQQSDPESEGGVDLARFCNIMGVSLSKARRVLYELFENLEPTESAPKVALPFQLSNEVDVARLQAILGISDNTALRLLRGGVLPAYKRTNSWRIEYDSVVDYCNRLRLEYGISESVAPRAPRTGRLRDRDLLPFPLDQTVWIREVGEVLDCSTHAVIYLIEQGDLTAYKVILGKASGCPWRIYRPSLERYLKTLHAAAGQGALTRSIELCRKRASTARGYVSQHPGDGNCG